jgi:2-polyprenyl-3-methyl-5-hydroxy-6-metoxy-1,4-benzoquinol methylase
MGRIQTTETDAYAELWSSVSNYKRFSPGEQYARVFHDLVQDPGATVLDAGCGEGRGLVALADLGYRVAGVDLTDAGLSPAAKAHPFVSQTLWHDLKPAVYLFHVQQPTVFRADSVDYIYCCDVMEHLPEQFTMLAVQRMLEVVDTGLFLSIYFNQEGYGPWVGRPLHLTVKPFVWWRDSLRELGTLADARDCDEAGIFYLRPR